MKKCYGARYDLLNGTATPELTKAGRPLQQGYNIVTVQRIEDSELWKAYVKKRKKIKDRGVKTLIDVMTTPLLPDDVKSSLCREVNEVYLFHATRHENLDPISRTGFRIAKPRDPRHFQTIEGGRDSVPDTCCT